MRAYDEDDELDRYVWTHFPQFFTDLERRVWKAAQVEEKARHASEPQERMLHARWGRASEPEVDAALASGWPSFRTEARARVLREHGAVVLVNRCPSCDRIVRTPGAQQCLWCGHDWHRR